LILPNPLILRGYFKKSHLVTAINFSYFRQITAPSHNFYSLALPSKFQAPEKLPHSPTIFLFYNCHFQKSFNNLWQTQSARNNLNCGKFQNPLLKHGSHILTVIDLGS